MRVIGLTGSIGSGKSTVAQILREMGVTVLDADALAREGSEVLREAICRRFPEVCETGELDRRRLGQLVFADPQARRDLEAILHPYVRQRMAEATRQAQQRGEPLIVQDIPLLFETGRERDFDGVLAVVAPTELRLRRVQARSGLSAEEFAARDSSQVPQEEKVRRATWVIWNDSDLESLRARVRGWLEGVRDEARA
ncbi:dephospho-CoA kinase [Calidithermus roseus]|uniref:Dephospho-CoA kinase n=1 Tax=Calidithermus roseus TaxID=1644118 RepID=A0A399ETP5_9DEIN|nr:dephospho-CoA kinase [Calidithermus roseus]RIH87358.1 Dephospho-CoA kinase [Calidithermus roseus]